MFAGAGEPTVDMTGDTRGDTCHIDVVDRWGNMVSATPSGGWLQSSPMISEIGFCLGSRLQMTWLEPGSPSTLTPGKRPRTTLTPTLVLKDGRPVAALGSPGGDQQDQWQLLYLLRTIVGGYSPQQAIDAPAFHTTSFRARSGRAPGPRWRHRRGPPRRRRDRRVGAARPPRHPGRRLDARPAVLRGERPGDRRGRGGCQSARGPGLRCRAVSAPGGDRRRGS